MFKSIVLSLVLVAVLVAMLSVCVAPARASTDLTCKWVNGKYICNESALTSNDCKGIRGLGYTSCRRRLWRSLWGK